MDVAKTATCVNATATTGTAQIAIIPTPRQSSESSRSYHPKVSTSRSTARCRGLRTGNNDAKQKTAVCCTEERSELDTTNVARLGTGLRVAAKDKRAISMRSCARMWCVCAPAEARVRLAHQPSLAARRRAATRRVE